MKHIQNGRGGSSERPQVSDLARQENGVPKGLSRCRACSDWKGRCHWPQPPLRHPTLTRIRCRCEADICKKCSEPTWEYKPGSNFYSEDTGEILRVRHAMSQIVELITLATEGRYAVLVRARSMSPPMASLSGS